MRSRRVRVRGRRGREKEGEEKKERISEGVSDKRERWSNILTC